MWLSLVIPVYGVEEFIKPLVSSLRAAKPEQDVEILFVDDCGPDRSVEILKRMIDSDGICNAKVKILHMPENGGLSAARNMGLRVASGDYVAFLDSDDAVTKSYFCSLKLASKSSKPDIIEFQLEEFSGDVPEIKIDKTTTSLVTGINTAECPPKGGFFAWKRIYKRSLIGALEFIPGILYEDVPFVSRMYDKADSVVIISDVLILYRKRPGSITHKLDARYSKLLENLLDAFLNVVCVGNSSMLTKLHYIRCLSKTIAKGGMKVQVSDVDIFIKEVDTLLKGSLQKNDFGKKIIYLWLKFLSLPPYKFLRGLWR